MEKHINNGRKVPPKTQKQWKLYEQLSQFCAALDRAQDTAQVQQDRLQSAPVGLLPMVF